MRNLSHLPFNTASTIKANNEEIVKMLNDYFKGSYRNVTNNQILRRYFIQSLSSELYNKGILIEESLDYSGIFLLDEKPILIIVNDIDHLQFEIHLSNPDDMISYLIDLYNVINKIEEKGIRYLYSPHYGYHSQCPRFTGTGFNIFSTLRLNILTSDLEKLEELRTIHKFSYNITEINSDKILEIQVLNQIGMTEKELLEKWKLIINDLIENDV
jgi:protein-arginine kinase